MSPLESKMNPDPTPVDGTENGLRVPPADWVVIVTTAGLTLAATCTIASLLFSWTTVWPVEAWLAAVEAALGAGMDGRTSATVASDATDAETTDAPIAAASSSRKRGGRGRAVEESSSGMGSAWVGTVAGDSGWTSVGRGNVSMALV
jgi:hypothetical protein